MKIYENFTSDNFIDDFITDVCIGGFDGVHFCLLYTSDAADDP